MIQQPERPWSIPAAGLTQVSVYPSQRPVSVMPSVACLAVTAEHVHYLLVGKGRQYPVDRGPADLRETDDHPFVDLLDRQMAVGRPENCHERIRQAHGYRRRRGRPPSSRHTR